MIAGTELRGCQLCDFDVCALCIGSASGKPGKSDDPIEGFGFQALLIIPSACNGKAPDRPDEGWPTAIFISIM